MAAANSSASISRMNPAGSEMNFPLTFSIAVGIDRNGFQEWDAKKYLVVGVGALIRRMKTSISRSR
jgi:hypothetical protein